LSFIGLFLIAIGTGGIKPCVASFGGEQFKLPEQQVQHSPFILQNIFFLFLNCEYVKP
jgi:solute carrier family 15 oligopeptide transporter 1